MVYHVLRNISRTGSRSKISEELVNAIESLRSELNQAAGNNNFSSDTVLELSQRLDKYIVLAQNQMLGRHEFICGESSTSRIKERTSSEYRFGSTL